VLYRLHTWLPLRVQWIAAWVLLPLGPIVYLLWPNDQSWQYGALSFIPLVALSATRPEVQDVRRQDAVLDFRDGPWGPP
jgi:hypothetical protein